MTTETNLIQKIAAATADLVGFAADKTNKQQNYDYISADQVLVKTAQALGRHGLALLPAVTSEVLEIVEPKPNQVRYDVTVHLAMIITDGVSQFEMPWVGRGSDYAAPDKALSKAITSGHKYFVMKLFCIGVGNEDGEHDAAEPATQNRQRGQAKAQPQAAKPKPAPADNPFDDPALVPAEMAAEIAEVGAAFYGDNWPAKQIELAEYASKGSSREIGQLLRSEAEVLLSGLKKRAAAAKQPA